MLNTKAVFERLNLGTSGLDAIQVVRKEIDQAADPLAKSNELINTIVGVDRKYGNLIFARMVAMAVADNAFKANHEIGDVEEFLNQAEARINALMADPNNRFMFVEAESDRRNVEPTEMKSIEGVEMKVAVKANGKIKKGGKEILAHELYKKHVLEAATAATNQEFIAVLMKQLQMSKAGATTYAYNCKKKLGEPAGGIVKAKKGRKAKAV